MGHTGEGQGLVFLPGPPGEPLSPGKVRAGGVSICRLSLAELCGLVINRQERRFHYTGMSGEGAGKASAPLLAPASPAALMDVPRTTAAGPGGRRPPPPPLTPPGRRPAARCSWPLGSCDGGGEARQQAGGGGRGAAAQTLSLYLLFLRTWAQVASALLLTFGCGRVSLGLDSARSWGWWASPTLSCWVGHVAAQKRAFGSREEDV